MELTKYEVELAPEELEFLREADGYKGRCPACGHLNALHNFHCCEFCKIPGCRCQQGELETERPVEAT